MISLDATWLVAGLLLAVPRPAEAHIALWHPSMYGFNGTRTGTPANYNNNAPVNPLRAIDDYTEDEWFHRFTSEPPLAGDVLRLQPGTSQTFELGCNRAFTAYRDPAIKDRDGGPNNTYACPDDEPGPLHTINNFGSEPDDQWLGGCALGIAYDGNVRNLKPTDFTIFSVNHTCVWTREVSFEVPADLPPCPAGGCTCTWNWIHTAGNYNDEGRTEGYASEFYLATYKCDVSNPTGFKALSTPVIPRECLSNPSRCRQGAKQALYFAQKTGNNLPDDLAKPPLYNAMYGFSNGAQNDIFSVNNITWEAGGQVPEGTGASAAVPSALVGRTSIVALVCGGALAAWLLVNT